MLMRKTAEGVALLLLLLSLSVKAQNPQWQVMKTQNLISFDEDCARKESFPEQALGSIVRRAIPPEDRGKGGTYGDRAVAMELRKEGATVYFVPTACRLEGCRWLLYTTNPVKSVGEIKGDHLFTYQSSQGMPLIVAARGTLTNTASLSTYSYSPETGKYRWLGDNYRVKEPEPGLPTFLKKAKRLCEGLSSPSIKWEDQKTVTVPIADLTLTLPAELAERSPSIEPNKNGDVTWTNYDYLWEKNDLTLEVSVHITNWDKDFPPETGGISPNAMLEQYYAAGEREKSRGEIEEVRYLELDGVKGVFGRVPYPGDENAITLSWATFRYHKGKAQRLHIMVKGVRSDLENLMNVINSARLAQK